MIIICANQCLAYGFIIVHNRLGILNRAYEYYSGGLMDFSLYGRLVWVE